MKIKYSNITDDSEFTLSCGCGIPENIDITDIPPEMESQVEMLTRNGIKAVITPTDDFCESVSVLFCGIRDHEGVYLRIKIRFTPVSFVCVRMRSSQLSIPLLDKVLHFRLACETGKKNYTPAMLAVDLGNTRTCAIVCPDTGAHILKMEKLQLDPHYATAVEPSYGVWDSICLLGKSKLHQKKSPSFVRLGKDNLFYMRDGSQESSALRSLSTPKRYFWDTDEDREWCLIRPGSAEEFLLREQTDMELAQQIAQQSYDGKYPRAMILEGTIFELLEQAERMLNQDLKNSSQYKLITHLTMTYPAAWSYEEIQAYREVIQRGIDHYVSQRCQGVPIELHLNCNEATSVLVNYIYSEAHRFGSGEKWLKLKGKVDPGSETGRSLRVAVIDIGGGTSDLAIANISWDNWNHATKIETCYTYGTNEAGDALIAGIIQKIILDKIFRLMVQDTLRGERFEKLKTFFVKDVIPALKSFSRSFWFPVAVAYLEKIGKIDSEMDDSGEDGRGSDFEIPLYTHQQSDSAQAKEGKHKGLGALAAGQTSRNTRVAKAAAEENSPFSNDFKDILDKFRKMVEEAGTELGKGLVVFVRTAESLNETLSLKFTQKDREEYKNLLNSCFRFSPMIFGSALAAYQCDIVIWSGKTSENSDIRELFQNQIPIPEDSFVSMNDYEIRSDDFPLTGLDGRLTDSKFATAIGAALYSMLQINGSAHLNLIASQGDDKQPRYWGKIDANGIFEPYLSPGEIRSQLLEYNGGLFLIYRSNSDSSLAFPSPAYEFRVKPSCNVENIKHIQFALLQADGKLDFELVNGDYILRDGTQKSVRDPDARDDFELKLRMVGTDEIWLDTGKIF